MVACGQKAASHFTVQAATLLIACLLQASNVR
jgi:hypothetical protein